MIKEGIEKEGVSRTFLHIRQLLLLQGCCLEGLVQVLAWTCSIVSFCFVSSQFNLVVSTIFLLESTLILLVLV